MKTIDAILTRKSVRQYSDKDISPKCLQTILKAGQAGPTARNKRDWQFLVVKDKKMLKQMAVFHSLIVSSPIINANMAILILGDKTLSADRYWEVDCTIAGQNMILAAHELGIGTCWIGTFPQENRMDAQKELFRLPEYVVPHSIIAFGYPKETKGFYKIKDKKPLLEEEKIHYEQW